MRQSPLVGFIALVVTVLIVAMGRPADAAGILAPTDTRVPPLRITDHLVDVSIRDGIAITDVTQTFRNDTSQRLEATYLFPLPEQADLTNFEMSFNGTMVTGEVLPAEEARQHYEQIVRQLRDPGLIEFVGRRLLRMRIFPVEPKSDTTIKLRYQQICRPVSDMQAYHYPLRTRATSGQAHGTVRFTVDLQTTEPLKSIWSPTHAVEIVRDDSERRARIGYEASGGSLEDDFTLLYDVDGTDVGLSVVASGGESSGDGGHFVLMMTPKQLWSRDSITPQDVVFVFDTSGSMAGEKLDQARKALGYCINQLNDHDRFSVVRFSTGFDVLHAAPAAATKENRAAAIAWINDARAAGGTNIADTLQCVMEMAAARDERTRPFVTVFLTDGRGNRGTNEIINVLESARPDGATVRVFPFGVGHDVNTHLLDALSERFTGRPTYVQPGEDLELVLGDFFSVVSRPVLTNLRLQLPDVGVTERFPATLGDLYHGQQLIVAGRFTHAGSGPVTLTAQRGGEQVTYAWPAVSFAPSADAPYVESVWAGRKIGYLLDQVRRHGSSDEFVTEIIELSQRYGIQTPYSSWFVNPEGIPMRPSPGGMARRVPSTLRALPARNLSGPGGGLGGGGAGDPGGEGRHPLPPSESSSSATTDATGTFDLSLASGEVATRVAELNDALKHTESRDATRADAARARIVQIGTKRFYRLGSYLVDSALTDAHQLHTIRFASDAWFELCRAHPELNEVFARQAEMVIELNAAHAVVIAVDEGIDELSRDQLQQLGGSMR